MTLDQCFQKYQGTAVLVDGIQADRGQCVQWADLVLKEVYGLPYHYGNAIDWWFNPQELLNYFDKIPYGINSYPKKGDFVIFNTGVGSVYGHIDVCSGDGNSNGFSAYDSNWDHTHFHDAQGYPILHQVQHIYGNYVIGYLRLKGGNIMKPTDQQIKDAFIQFNQTPSDQQLGYYKDRTIDILYSDLLGGDKPNAQEVKDAFQKYLGSAPNANQLAYYPNRSKAILYQDLAGAKSTGVSKQNVLDYINKNLQ